ncbi:putative thiosulfate sulfurtransferase [Dirofilaria immitis]|nr:putative thiosulfate sulfurtransferase [Dirofilaria immitis]
MVADLLKKGGFRNGGGYRLLDCTGDFEPRSHEDFMKTKQYRDYLEKHIPQAVYMDLNIATYPSLYEPYAMYPPEIFQKYARLLGINQSDHIVLYGRHYIAGMMFPCRISWLFKYYGHRAVSVVDGGLTAWEKDGGETTREVPEATPGNWRAKFCPDYIVTYEQLIEKDSTGTNTFDKIDQINFLDSRPRDQFEGRVDTMLDPKKVNGSRVSGTKCAPAVEMINETGRLKDPNELKSWLQKCGFKEDLPTVSHCLRGIQACMLNSIIEDLFPSQHPRTYHGSCIELQARDPKRISE